MKKKLLESLSKVRVQLVDGWLKASKNYCEFKNSPSGKKFLKFLWELFKVVIKAVLAYLIKKLLTHFFG